MAAIGLPRLTRILNIGVMTGIRPMMFTWTTRTMGITSTIADILAGPELRSASRSNRLTAWQFDEVLNRHVQLLAIVRSWAGFDFTEPWCDAASGLEEIVWP